MPKTKPAVQQEQKVLPDKFSPNAYRLVFRDAADLDDSRMFPFPQGQWRFVRRDSHYNRLPTVPESNEPFFAVPKGVVRGKTTMAWKDLRKALKTMLTTRKDDLMEINVIAVSDGSDVLAPRQTPSVQTPEPTQNEVLAKAATPEPLVIPKAAEKAVAQMPPESRAAAQAPANAFTTGDFETDVEESDSGNMALILGVGAAIALLILMRRGN